MAKSQTFHSLGCGKNIPVDLYQTGEFEAFYFMDIDSVEGNFPHFHNYYELLLVMQGKINVAAEGKLYHILDGSIIIIPPHTQHCTIVLKGTAIYERIILHWRPSFLNFLTETGRLPMGDFFQKVSIVGCTSSDTAIYRILLERFLTEFHTAVPDDKFSLKIQETVITELLLRCARDICNIKTKPSAESSHTVSRVIEYINDHFLDEDLSLKGISELFFISSGNLSKLFRTYTGTTVYQYIIQKRLFCARNLLAKDLSVIEACFGCGFQDYTCFLKAFRRTFHCTPKEFQKIVKESRLF